MQPGDGNQQQYDPARGDRPPYGNSGFGGPAGAPFRGQPEPGPYGPPAGPGGGFGDGPGGGPVYAPPGAADQRRGRPGLIVLVSFLVQLVLVAAVGNQWVTEKLVDFQNDHGGLLGYFAITPTTYAWRFTPRDGDNFHSWAAQLAGLGTGFVVAALLTLALVRGAITFGRAFFAVWMSVIVATFIGGMAFRAIVDERLLGGDIAGLGDGGKEKVFNIVFRANGQELPAGIGLGVVVALIAGLVAVITRRRVAVAPLPAPAEPVAGPEPEAPPPYYGEPARDGSDSNTLSMQKVQDSVTGEPDQRAERPYPQADSPYRRPSDPEPGDERSATAATTAIPLAGAAAAPRSADTAAGPERAVEPEPPAEPESEPESTQAMPAPQPERAVEPERPAEPESTQAMSSADSPSTPAQINEPGPEQDDRATRAIPIQGAGNPAPPQGDPNEQTVRRGDLPPGAFGRPAEPQPTQAFPRPPDDEDLGQHPDHHND